MTAPGAFCGAGLDKFKPPCYTNIPRPMTGASALCPKGYPSHWGKVRCIVQRAFFCRSVTGFSRITVRSAAPKTRSLVPDFSSVHIPEIVNWDFAAAPRRRILPNLINEKGGATPPFICFRSKSEMPPPAPFDRPNATKPLSFCCVRTKSNKYPYCKERTLVTLCISGSMLQQNFGFVSFGLLPSFPVYWQNHPTLSAPICQLESAYTLRLPGAALRRRLLLCNC